MADGRGPIAGDEAPADVSAGAPGPVRSDAPADDARVAAGVRIELMAPLDIPRCVELEQLLFAEDDPWGAHAFLSELAASHNRYLVARDDSGRMLGYAGVALLGNAEHPEAEVHTIGVDPESHRAGIGTALLHALLAEADQRGGPVFLEVRTDNAPAIALYAKYGFHIIGLRKNYYHPSGADAYTMRRPELTEQGREWHAALERPNEVHT